MIEMQQLVERPRLTTTTTPNGTLPHGRSTYVQYLPTPYQNDDFVGRFLLIFESILQPIERTIDNVAAYFDPQLTPAQMLPWLAAWVGLDLDENWPETSQRALVAKAAVISRWRGTRFGLREHLRAYLGHRPLIVENFDGMRLGQDAALGINTRLGDPRPFQLTITAFADRPEEVDEHALQQILAFQKPAHSGYTIDVRPYAECVCESRDNHRTPAASGAAVVGLPLGIAAES